MSRRLIKYYKGPTYSKTEWSTRNPELEIGEIGYEYDDDDGLKIVKRAKVGPGLWNSLSYLTTDYPYTEAVTNPIGDAVGDLSGLQANEILNKMLNPYQVPVISGVGNNAGGGYASEKTLQIGSSLSGQIGIVYSVSHPENLLGNEPINITSNAAYFSNEGNFINTGSSFLSLPSPLQPAVPTTIEISLYPKHKNGNGGIVKTKINFFPNIIWGVSPSATLDATGFVNIGQKNNIVTDNYKRDYPFTAAGYAWIGIPQMLNPTNMIFTDVSDPNAPAGFQISDMGVLSVNNGVGTYNYQMFRSDFYLIDTSILRIS